MSDVLADLFDQFDYEEQARIKAAAEGASEILAQGSAAARDRLLAANSPDLNDWSLEPANDAQADAAGIVFTAYANGLWRQTDPTRSECIQEFVTKVEKLGDPILAKYGVAGQGLINDLLKQCRTNVELVLKNIAPAQAPDRIKQAETEDGQLGGVPAHFLSFVKQCGLVAFSHRWRMQQRGYQHLQAVYARHRGRNGAEFQRQEELIRDARAWAEAGLGERLSEVQHVFELKGRVAKWTYDDFVSTHKYRSDLLLGYREFETALWEEGSPSLEDLAIKALAERASSAAIAKLSNELQLSAVTEDAREEMPSKSIGLRSTKLEVFETPAPEQGPVASAGGSLRRFRKAGDFWSLQFDGKSVSVVHRVGMAYIEHLLRSPGRSFRCMELQTAVGGNPNGSVALDKNDKAELPAESFNGDYILDERAREQYGKRLASVENELLEAERNNDIGQRERLKEEKQRLIEELQAATGLAGRPREFATDAERARKAVAGAISTALNKIAKHHPELAKHLGERLERGAQCCYKGDGIPWEV
jgi:hypothetical protein